MVPSGGAGAASVLGGAAGQAVQGPGEGGGAGVRQLQLGEEQEVRRAGSSSGGRQVSPDQQGEN